MAYLSEYFAVVNGEFFLNLNKPIFLPKSIFFNTALPLIYVVYIISITISVYHKETRKTLVFWVLIAILNITWCAVFFKFKMLYLAQEIIMLILAIMVYLECVFIRKNLKLALLILPITIFYVFAVVLSFGFIVIN
ncbi:MAG: tryptophan-rich sensory protein [Clostridia bacterium]|nr:tryptophan-rich sensory protein [Clostridia bacterium]